MGIRRKEVNIISRYCKNGEVYKENLKKMDLMLREMRGEVILGMDANAKSVMWHSKLMIGRGINCMS